MATLTDDLDAVRQIVAALEPFELDDQERILRWVREKLGLATVQPDKPPSQPQTPQLDPAASPQQHQTPLDIKKFVDSKRPHNDQAFAATIAYYYRFEAPAADRKESVSKDDLIEACRLAGRERLRAPAQTLNNAHAAGLLDREDRGMYRISTVGENLVAMTLGLTGESAQLTPAKRRARRSKKKAVKRKPSQRNKKPATRATAPTAK